MQRFLWLDAARGIAAIAVMLYHFSPHGGVFQPFFQSAYLAVDLFFIMSGFVLAHAYESKLLSGAMNFGRFLAVRLIRLYPVYAVGFLLGGAYYLAKMLMGTADAASAGDWATLIALSMVFAPNPGWVTEPAGIFPFAPSTWSLSTEMVASVLYGALLFRLPSRWLAAVFVVVTVAFVWTAAAAQHIDLGWAWSNFGPGVLRTVSLFSFGVLLFRARKSVVVRSGAWGSGLLLVISAVLVLLPEQPYLLNVLLVYSLFPIFVFADPGRGSPWFDRISSELGRLSYPVYVLHTPVQLWVLGAAKFFKIDYAAYPRALMILLVLLVLAASYIVLIVFDEPIRSALSRRLRRRAPVDPKLVSAGEN